MILGKLLLLSGFVFFIINSASAVLLQKSNTPANEKTFRFSFYAGLFVSAAAILLLYYLIFTHRFEYIFVYKYSSRDLPWYFLFSSLWAGQAGTFLLWALFNAIFTLMILKKESAYGNIAVAVLSSVSAFLFLLAMKVDPFEYTWVAEAGKMAFGSIPLDGQGMNPLLQDYWMVIHPPVLFLGYSSTAVPFAMIIARLFGEDNNFAGRIHPWAINSMFWLSLGIIMGGYWSYTTLGWGGYWAWDPVENASLVPFLLMTAYVHLLILERKNGVLVRLNLLFGALPFLAVLYGSFLTRSGVLADFSVHSFIDQGINTFLILFILIYLALFFFAYFLNFRRIHSARLEAEFITRESFLYYGTLIIVLFAVIVFAGTSSPLFTTLFMSSPANVSIDFYNRVGSVVTVIIMLLIGITPLLAWKTGKNGFPLKKTLIYLLISALITFLFYFLGMSKPLSVILTLFSLFAVLLSGEFIVKHGAKKLIKAGGFIAHLGLGLMAVGVVFSSMYDESQRIALSPGTEKEALGYRIYYKGIEIGERGHDFAVLEVSGNGEQFTATPKFYYSGYTRSYMTTPHLRNHFAFDLYIAPIQLLKGDEINPGEQITLKKNQPVDFRGLKLEMTGFSMNRDEKTGSIEALTNIKIISDSLETTLHPGILVAGNQRKLLPDTLGSPRYYFTVTGIMVDNAEATLYVANEEEMRNRPDEYLVIEVSKKPWIWVLWLGTLLLFAGAILAYYRRKNSD